MHEAGERLGRLRRLDSETKATRVLAALDAMVSAGEPLQVTGVARRAAVSRRFVYDHPELRAEIARRSVEVTDRFATTMAAAARVSGASLRADLENARAQNRRLQDRISLLDRRLGETVGDEVRAEMAGRGTLVTADALQARIDGLDDDLASARAELARRSDELDAARQINRELMARLNLERR
ncbi:MAG TPA: DUF6262 family protein [Acidimicrobiales bacterium]|nr:DUF6262 family protein [Acidimicrobiales bacterium]